MPGILKNYTSRHLFLTQVMAWVGTGLALGENDLED